MNKGVINQIKIEKGKTIFQINLDLQYVKKDGKEEKRFNIFLVETPNKPIPILVESSEWFTFESCSNLFSLLNKKCEFELKTDEIIAITEKTVTISNDSKPTLQSITIKADE